MLRSASKFSLSILVVLVGLLSCREEEAEMPKKSLLPFGSGNYWIYRTTVTSADGVEQVFRYLDSVWIQKDTIIDGIWYQKQLGTLSGAYYLRDSAGCVIRRQLNFEQIIYATSPDTLYKNPPVYQVVTDRHAMTSVPAGEFRTMTCRVLLRKGADTDHHQDDYPSFDDRFYTGEQYICSSEVGLVKNVYYYLGGTIEYELVRYSVN